MSIPISQFIPLPLPPRGVYMFVLYVCASISALKIIFKNFLFIFGCTGSSLLRGLFSSSGEQGLLSSCSGQASHCGGFSCCGARAQGTWASAAVAHGSVVVVPRLSSTNSVGVAHRIICSMAHGILLSQESNPCLLYWQVDSLPLSHQGSL